jgi:hypothetical protein
MSLEFHFDDDLAQRRVRRLEQKLRRAHTALANARYDYRTLRALPSASEQQKDHALQQVERAQRELSEIERDLELAVLAAESRPEAPGFGAEDALLWE